MPDGHAEGCWGAHVPDISCEQAIAWRERYRRWREPWTCNKNPHETGWPAHNPTDDGICRYCGVDMSTLPVERKSDV